LDNETHKKEDEKLLDSLSRKKTLSSLYHIKEQGDITSIDAIGRHARDVHNVLLSTVAFINSDDEVTCCDATLPPVSTSTHDLAQDQLIDIDYLNSVPIRAQEGTRVAVMNKNKTRLKHMDILPVHGDGSCSYRYLFILPHLLSSPL
jgi:hypothetical protein